MMTDEIFLEQELVASVDEILGDDRVMMTFDLPAETVKQLLKVKVTDKGFDVSPNFQSIGWGENEGDQLQINLSDLGNDRAVLKHELKHAIHCLVCARLFRGGEAIDNFNLFIERVMKDPGFYEWRDKSTGLVAEQQWEEIEDLANKRSGLTRVEIEKRALLLGSVLYQHAYFVDPIMCEAVASTGDGGFAGLNGRLNRLVGKMIPDEQVIEGYGWQEAQEAFGRASFKKKAMLIQKEDYSRKEYFGVL